jgi:hypothetical protein
VFLTYAEVMAGNDVFEPIERWVDGAREMGLFGAAVEYLPSSMFVGWLASWALASVYYVLRTWQNQRMCVALNKTADALLHAFARTPV